MKLHPPIPTKRLWSYLRVSFFMLRKGLISKRKLMMDINLTMKRGKLIGKAFGNHVFNHHRSRSRGYGLQEYEFSCNNSPNPVFFHANRSARSNHYFPCIGAVAEEDDEGGANTVPSEETHQWSVFCSSVEASEEEEEEEEKEEREENEVDGEAEEFIRRFYEQLRRQSRFALLQYEIDYQEMLARGC